MSKTNVKVKRYPMGKSGRKPGEYPFHGMNAMKHMEEEARRTVDSRRRLDELQAMGYTVGSCIKCVFFLPVEDELPDRCVIHRSFYIKVSPSARCDRYGLRSGRNG